MSDQTPLPRETGAEQSSRSCPNCGGPMQLLTTAYGSVSARCPKCYDAPPQKASAPAVVREKGTTVSETPEEAPSA